MMQSRRKWFLAVLLVMLLIVMVPDVMMANAFATEAKEYYSNAYSGYSYTTDSNVAEMLTGIMNGTISIFDGEGGYAVGSSIGTGQHSFGGTYGWTCWAYANAVYYKMFGVVPEKNGSSYAPLRGATYISYDVFSSAGIKCGTYIRTTGNSDGSDNGSNGHSIIVLSYDAANLTFLDCNWSSDAVIKLQTRTWDSMNAYYVNYKGRKIGRVTIPSYSNPASTFQFIDVIYPKTFRIDTTNGWYLEGGTLESNNTLTMIRSQILDGAGTAISDSGEKPISGYSYSVKALDDKSGTNNGVRFSWIHDPGDYIWRLTARDSAGRTLVMDMPFNADNSVSTSTASMSKEYQETPGKPTLTVSPGNTYKETVISWNATEHTTHYRVKLSSIAVHYQWENLDYWEQTSDKLNFSALLSPGAYYVTVYAVNKNNDLSTSSGRKLFYVGTGSSPEPGTLYDSREGNGSLYKLFSKDCTWLAAKSLAKSSGGHLVTINSQEEQNIVQQLTSGFGNWVFMGAESFTAGHWRWITGEDFSFTHWNDGQPDNWEGKENCGMLYANGTWNDVPCTYSDIHGYIAEYPATELTITAKESSYPDDYQFTKDDFTVNVTFADGTTMETEQYKFSSFNKNMGKHLIIVYYGERDDDVGAHVQIPISVPIESIDFNTGMLEFASPGAPAQTIRATLSPEDAIGGLRWESYDESVATVDESGNVTPHSVGISLITCEAADSDSFAYDECLAIVHAAKPLRLPAMLKTIEREAFRGIEAEEIYIPEGIQTIGAYAFADCKSLRIVHIPGSVDAISSSAFNGCEDIKFITDIYGEPTDFAEAHDIEYFIFEE